VVRLTVGAGEAGKSSGPRIDHRIPPWPWAASDLWTRFNNAGTVTNEVEIAVASWYEPGGFKRLPQCAGRNDLSPGPSSHNFCRSIDTETHSGPRLRHAGSVVVADDCPPSTGYHPRGLRRSRCAKHRHTTPRRYRRCHEVPRGSAASGRPAGTVPGTPYLTVPGTPYLIFRS